MDRHAMPLAVANEHVGLARLAVVDATRRWAAAVAEAAAVGIDVHEDVVGAARADDLAGGVAGDALGAPVPVGDAPVPVEKVDAVVEVVEDSLKLIAVVHAAVLAEGAGATAPRHRSTAPAVG
jgi:hypothetical protein